jgi:hypothetical protein
MNKRAIIACLVGALIVFGWQFVSNTFGGLHKPNQKYTANQDAILTALNTNLTEDGTYMLPTVAPGASMDDENKLFETMIGKPTAEIHYRKSMQVNIGMNLFRGYLADLVALAFLVFWVLPNFQNINVKNTMLACLGAALCMYLTTSYGNAIWYETNSIPDLLDAIVSWGLAGTWLGYYLKR